MRDPAAVRQTYRALAITLVVIFVGSVARFYHRDSGFTALIGFSAGKTNESPALRAIPHYTYPRWASYDGQYYAQRAFDPLLRDPEVDHAMDLAPYRARRILFSWTAYALGCGRPAWILQVYALQNVVCWLLLAGLLARWVPPVSGRGLALWAACLFSHGMLWSVRFALLDGPSLLMIACAVVAVEHGRPLLSAAVVGIAGLGRETNLLGILAQPIPSSVRASMRLLGAVVTAALPLLIWEDYLRSIYRSTIFAGTDQFVLPGSGLAWSWRMVLAGVATPGLFSGSVFLLSLLCALAVQAVYLIVRREYAAPWWRIAAGYAILLLFLDPILADPRTGAITRVMLPMTVGFNILLASEPRRRLFWPWFVCGNLHLVPAPWVMPLIPGS
jgi:hypothetical protein